MGGMPDRRELSLRVSRPEEVRDAGPGCETEKREKERDPVEMPKNAGGMPNAKKIFGPSTHAAARISFLKDKMS